MSALPVPQQARTIVYPQSDGKRIADNTEQARWIFVLYGNIDAMLREGKAFVAADLFWYAKEGFPKECEAPDVFVAFGRPRGKRPSYKQWEEEGIAPQVVFEVFSPGNTQKDMERKDAFYTEYGVEEYYIFNPEKNTLEVYLRKGTVLRRQWIQGEFTSPLLGIRFDLTGEEMQVFYPDGRRFLTFTELEVERAKEQQLRLNAEAKLQKTQQTLQTTQQTLQSTQQRMTRLAELSRKLLDQKATAEEIAELQQLAALPPPG